MLELPLAAIGGYLLGAVPFGLVLTRLAGLGDIRQIGSGNIGATNVLRTGNKPLALATLLLDSGKGAIAAVIAQMLAGPEAAMLAGFAAVVGHNFPVWLGFKGGKGFATTLGVLLVCNPLVGAGCIAAWLLIFALARISSLSAIVSLLAAPALSWYLADSEMTGLASGLALLGLVRHHANIKRLLAGTEPRVGKKTEQA